MSHITRQQPNGNWCIYSTVTEEFIVYNASREELIEYQLERYRENLEDDLDQIEGHGCKPPKTNRTREFSDLIELSDLTLTENGELQK